MEHIPGIPNGNYNFKTWCDGKNYYSLNTETKTVLGYYEKMLECGCCSEPVDYDWDWDQLDEESQILIKEEVYLKLYMLNKQKVQAKYPDAWCYNDGAGNYFIYNSVVNSYHFRIAIGDNENIAWQRAADNL